MHKIDPSNPSRQFFFSIVVIGDKYSGIIQTTALQHKQSKCNTQKRRYATNPVFFPLSSCIFDFEIFID